MDPNNIEFELRIGAQGQQERVTSVRIKIRLLRHDNSRELARLCTATKVI